MNISNVCSAIAETGRTITGIKSVYQRSPVKIDTVDLPCLVALSGPASYPGAGAESDLVNEQREFRVQVVVSPEGQSDIEKIEADSETLLYATVQRYLAAPALGAPWLVSVVIGDTGVIELVSFDGMYIGFEVRLMVSDTRARNYLPGQ